jgi:hypothetical protein
MIRREGKTKEGRISEHSLDATGARVYQVAEFDFAEFAPDGVTETAWTPLVREWKAQGISLTDAAAALHLHLSFLRDLVLCVHSGGKSLHGWYACWNLSEEQNRQFFEYACRLGADPLLWTRSQFVRMPDGTRADGTPQRLYYLDPEKAVKA